MAVRYLRGLPRLFDELAYRARHLAAAGAVLAVVVSWGAASHPATDRVQPRIRHLKL